MDLSVIIVSYNVKFFLEQCLCSVQKAIAGMEAEVIVVDNHSTDGSIEYLQPSFPKVQFIASKENLGFGKANNLALKIAKGKYILFLNPDTIVPEDCFKKCISFFESNKDCGALGIKMIDGTGIFLAESKRSFPSPITSFYKLSGLSSLFPKSAIFNRYALGNLDENQNHEVDVICGAFMMLTKEAADKTNGFDEAFFMYGEDVDLSYRIQQLGLKNYYFSETTIIHFKGESAGQQSLKHNKMFYEAMLVFVKKHYGGSKATLFSILLQMAILFRSAIGFVGKIFTSTAQQKEQPNHFLLFGDEGEIEATSNLLHDKTIKQVIISKSIVEQLPSTQNAHIVFCEGNGFRNATIIQFIHQQKGKNSYWFHEKNSQSIIGSNSKTVVGKIIS